MFLIKKWMFALPFVICWNAPHLNAVHSTHKIELVADKSYAFRAFYKVQIPSSPSNLLVEVVHESNMRSDSHPTELPGMRFLELRFTLDGSQNRVKIWGAYQGKYTISGLASSAHSIWHPAIKKLAENLAVLYWGGQKSPIPNSHKPQSSSLHITPLSNRKLHTYDILLINSSSHPDKSVSVDVDVQLETHKQRKVVVAVATLHGRGLAGIKKKYATLKFVSTKQGLKELSRKNIESSSIWYSWMKKIAHQSMHRYFKFKHFHTQAVQVSEKYKKHNLNYVYVEDEPQVNFSDIRHVPIVPVID